jgi:hypothetical protein
MPNVHSSLVGLDPTYEPVTQARSGHARAIAVAPRSWSGLRIGLLANGKTNSQEILEALLAELARQPDVSVGETVRICKSNESTRPRPEDFQRLVNETDVVLTAIGD